MSSFCYAGWRYSPATEEFKYDYPPRDWHMELMKTERLGYVIHLHPKDDPEGESAKFFMRHNVRWRKRFPLRWDYCEAKASLLLDSLIATPYNLKCRHRDFAISYGYLM